MNEGVPKQFSSPEEEINYLRQQIAERERDLMERSPEVDEADVETMGREALKDYVSFTPKMVLDKDYEINPTEATQTAESIEVSIDPVEDLLNLAKEKGIKNALTVLDKTNNAFVIDEVHRRLIEEIKSGVQLSDMREGVPPWHVLHMTLYEVTLPARPKTNEKEYVLDDLVGVMEQLFTGLRNIGSAKAGNHFVFEVAVPNDTEDIIFYVSVPNESKALFEKQTLSLFPQAILTEQTHDYNVYINNGHSLVADVQLNKHPIYPLKTAEEFPSDPLAVILNAFSKIEKEGGGAAIQFSIRQPKKNYRKQFKEIVKLVEKGETPSKAISRSTISGEVFATVSSLFNDTKKDGEEKSGKEIDTKVLELFEKKLDSESFEVNIRLVVSAENLIMAESIMSELQSSFNQFDSQNGNQLKFKSQTGVHLRHAQRAFSFRQFSPKTALPLSRKELATLIHFPEEGTVSSPQFKQSHSKTAPAPTDMPSEGTLLGKNIHRGNEKPILVTEKDRMRHFYIIGQTGTGKSIFLQNLIVQDIKAGAGVCMIDPHGSDIEDVLGAIPPERHGDVIYFDPSHLDTSIGLNMLEYDPARPEQKTFIVGELLSIFQKLYGANPESMGPMFEQYFRNSAMLVMEDPASGNTLMDISRVMADSKFRRAKLAKATNLTVVQFWREIAGKAGGEASLENVVPYIVSKIDPLTSNDYIRPIIGQQKSSFNFRQIMDDRKILLVNLSKGRLGEINANLIGMIIVGKILMAALSRVDDPTKSFPPFYLHIDEFQNISTPAIASILSEARKYKLGLSMAHQFIAQLQPEIRDAVFGNVGSMAAFRVGTDDAVELESQFAPVFSANDIMNTPNYNAIVRVLANGVPTPPFSVATLPPPPSDPSIIQGIIQQSYAKYGRPREEIEEEIRLRYQKPVPPVPRADGIL
jgi:hypothetical protein